jgi:cytochrome bd ubiquinol oxidase subunit I
MTDLLAARSQMALSLAFHILFAVAGMAMPLLMLVAEILYRRTKKNVYLDLAQRWSKGTAVLFAVGAVSGTVLSFELGLLWPTFMRHAGPIIGMPFSLEGFAFFLEAIFLGIYLYGRKRVTSTMHLLSAIVVTVSGLASGIFVVSVNAWMNTPTGFRIKNGIYADIDVWKAFFNPAFPTQALHMALAAYASVAFAVCGIHAGSLLRDPKSKLHRAAFKIALGIAIISTPLQIASGDLAAKHLAVAQPLKLAAMEGLFQTTRNAPLSIGGWPDVEKRQMSFAIKIPGALSFLAKSDFNAEIIGLNAFNKSDWPAVSVVHIAFQLMIACGVIMLTIAVWGAWLWRRQNFTSQFLKACVFTSPLGLIALEAGWTVTEVGRQPWIIHGVMRTRDAVTPMPHLVVPLLIFSALYLFLGIVVVVILRAYVFEADKP